MDLLDGFYKEVYDKEVQRRHQLTTYLPFRATLMGGIATLLINSFSFTKFISYENTIGGRFLHLIEINTYGTIISVISISMTIYYLLRFHFGHQYNHPGYPDKINEYCENLKKFYSNKDENSEENLKNDINSYLIKEYIDCASLNMKVNDTKTAYMHQADVFLTISAILTLFMLCSTVLK